jgi:hypothetical protein
MDDFTQKVLYGGKCQEPDPLEGGTNTTPILVSVFRAVGWLVAIATAIFVAAVFASENKLLSVPTALIAVGSGGITALIFFGIAQVLQGFANIEHYASHEKNEAVLSSLHRIEGLLEAMRGDKKDD